MNALATITRNALATVETAAIETITISNARSQDERFKRVAEASASTYDCYLLIRHVGKHLTKKELHMVEYALARAKYRENRDLTLRECALLAQQTVAQVQHSLRYLGHQVTEYLSADLATRVMMRNANEV